MHESRLPRLVTALLFLHADAVQLDTLAAWLELDRLALDSVLAELSEPMVAMGLAIQIVDNGVRLTTAPDLHEALRDLVEIARTEPEPLSHGAWETLAIVAYRQPITRLEVEAIRQAGSERSLATLQERGLIEEVGRKETPGRPILYGTTAYFLEQFGLADAQALPPLPSETPLDPEV
jgi:segregation and condensation protein B